MFRRVAPDWRQSDVFRLAVIALCESQDQVHRRVRRRRATFVIGTGLAAMIFFTFGPGLAVADRSESPRRPLACATDSAARTAAAPPPSAPELLERQRTAPAPPLQREPPGARSAATRTINDLPVAPLE